MMTVRAALLAVVLLAGPSAPRGEARQPATPTRAPSAMATPVERAEVEGTDAIIVVDNDSWRDVIVFTLQSGVRVRLGRTPALTMREYKVSCQRFMDRRTDFLLRQLGSRAGRFLRGEPLAHCDQKIVIRLHQGGLRSARLFLR